MINMNFRVWRIGILSLLLSGAMGCTQLFNVSKTKDISEVSKLNPSESKSWVCSFDRLLKSNCKNGMPPVAVKGTVSKTIAFIDSGAYQLQDKTGTIWIFTEQTLPSIGQNAIVKGNLEYQSIEIESKDLGEVYLRESDRNYYLTTEVIGVPRSQSESNK